MRNLRLDICYDGSRYRGWQRLPGAENTLQGKVETALTRILGEPIEISGSGRTDAGVHAMGQVASFHCESKMPAEEILEQLRRYLPEDIGIISCREASQRFHARLNAKQKVYRYRIWNSEAPCVFERKYVWVNPNRLDVAAMERAAKNLIGTHDFAAFCANPRMKKSTVRALEEISIVRRGNEVHLTFRGNGFLHHMVRILVGTLVEVGEGKRDPQSVSQLFTARREQAGFLAPASGLCLMEVIY